MPANCDLLANSGSTVGKSVNFTIRSNAALNSAIGSDEFADMFSRSLKSAKFVLDRWNHCEVNRSASGSG